MTFIDLIKKSPCLGHLRSKGQQLPYNLLPARKQHLKLPVIQHLSRTTLGYCSEPPYRNDKCYVKLVQRDHYLRFIVLKDLQILRNSFAIFSLDSRMQFEVAGIEAVGKPIHSLDIDRIRMEFEWVAFDWMFWQRFDYDEREFR